MDYCNLKIAMTVSTITELGFASRLVNGVLSIKPLANWAKHQAREMMIQRAEKMGVPWRTHAQTLLSRDWQSEFAEVNNPDLNYPDYYLSSFHAYEEGNLSWQAAVEVEVAAYAVHAKIWPEAGVKGDAKLRQSYHDILKAQLPESPQNIVDLGCSVGLSTFTLQDIYPNAHITGVDLSPYFLAVALYNTPKQASQNPPTWVHAAAESTGLPDASFDLVSICLVCHELPQTATFKIFTGSSAFIASGRSSCHYGYEPEIRRDC